MVCLDSTFVIDILKGAEKAEELEENIDNRGEDIFIASPSIIEVVRGLYLKSNIKNLKNNEKERTFKLINSLSVLDLDKNSAILAAKIEADLKNNGEIIDIEDVMIAAITINNNETLITRNKKHFERIKDLKIEAY